MNEVTPPPPPPPPPPPSSSPPPPPPPSGEPPSPTVKGSLPAALFRGDARSLETLKWSAAYNAVATAINIVVGVIASKFMGGLIGEIQRTFGSLVTNFPLRNSIKELVWAAIYGALIGFFLSKYYTQIQYWNARYLKGKLNTFFKLLFYPAVVVNLVVFFLLRPTSFATGIVYGIILFAGFIISSYVYAKLMDKKLGQFFNPTA